MFYFLLKLWDYLIYVKLYLTRILSPILILLIQELRITEWFVRTKNSISLE